MASGTAQGTTQSGHLARTLSMWAIVGLGLGYMTPTVVFDTFGIVSDETNGVVPTSYMFALVVMTFTASRCRRRIANRDIRARWPAH